MRTLVIGDIHSGLKALVQVLEKVILQPSDKLIFLGDYVDGWSQAPDTIEFLISLQQKYHCIFIRGNHDQLCLDWLLNGKEDKLWLQHGGNATRNAYLKESKKVKQIHIEFLENLKNYYLDEENRLFVHAGFTNLKGIAYEYFPKNFYWDRTLWELALAVDKNLDTNAITYPKRLLIYREIYIGHTPVSRINKTTPQQEANVWNIDTGAAFKGPLSVLDIDSKIIWQSDPVYTLYPNEIGRN